MPCIPNDVRPKPRCGVRLTSLVEAGGALFEKRGDDDDFVFAGELLERGGGGAGDGFGELEKCVIIAQAEVMGSEQLPGAAGQGAIQGGTFSGGSGAAGDYNQPCRGGSLLVIK